MKVQGFTWTVEDVNLISETEVWGDVLVALGEANPDIVAMTADLANSTKIRPFKQRFPERFINVGIAEQNLLAVAAGVAALGFVPVVCTYATFATLRAAEFLRTDICYGARNVKIIGTLAGVAFGQGGPTHHSTEDLAFTRAIPGLVVLVPSDGTEMGEALRAAIAHDGPVYLRTGRGIEPPLARADSAPFAIGRARLVRPGDDVTVIGCGPPVHAALRAAERAAARGIQTRVLNMATLKPLDVDAVCAAARESRGIITVEDHNVIGGLGGAVAETLARAGLACRFTTLGHQDRFLGMGIPEDLMEVGGFGEDAILAEICRSAGPDVVDDVVDDERGPETLDDQDDRWHDEW